MSRILKIDRLLGIVIYLLNRDIASASTLAERFEVSPRTIQRDIETLSLAGIPVSSVQGINGGYSILKNYKISNQVLSVQDHIIVITALKGLLTAYNSPHIEDIFEKIMSLTPDKATEQSIQLDFSVLREGLNVSDCLTDLEKAIKNKNIIEFEYTNSENSRTNRVVEPLILTYKWYAWYLFAFCWQKHDYRMFKITRIRKLKLTNRSFTKVHENAEKLLEKSNDSRKYINIKLKYKLEMDVLLKESFPNSKVYKMGDDESIMEFSVPEEEKGWFGTLLGYGKNITVLEPDKLKKRLIEKAKEIIENYG